MKYVFEWKGYKGVAMCGAYGVFRGHIKNHPELLFTGHDRVEAEANFRDKIDILILGSAGVWSDRYETTRAIGEAARITQAFQQMGMA